MICQVYTRNYEDTKREYTPALKHYKTPQGTPTSRQLQSNEVSIIKEVFTECYDSPYK